MTNPQSENPLVMISASLLGSAFGFIEYAGDVGMSVLLGITSAFGVWLFNKAIKPWLEKKWKKH
jgi:lipopolysaccharide export LptBFGC system permease protein LptF